MIVLAGGSGFLGRKLAKRLETAGHRSITLSRRPSGDGNQIAWQPDGNPGELPRHIDGVDAIVNLAGEGIADKRWTEARKNALWSSRILSTRTLVRAVAECATPPKVFISGSGIGQAYEVLDEPIEFVGWRDRRFRDRLDFLADGHQHVRDDAAIERELVGEVVVDHRLVHAGEGRDVVHAHAIESLCGKQRGRGLEDGIASRRGSSVLTRRHIN